MFRIFFSSGEIVFCLLGIEIVTSNRIFNLLQSTRTIKDHVGTDKAEDCHGEHRHCQIFGQNKANQNERYGVLRENGLGRQRQATTTSMPPDADRPFISQAGIASNVVVITVDPE